MGVSLSARRAWIEIFPWDLTGGLSCKSLSARRAWIEIDFTGSAWVSEFVALRKESVDRNNLHYVEEVSGDTSLSARRAWIEIGWAGQLIKSSIVALRKESVDRNCIIVTVGLLMFSRSPQGERG